MYYRRDLPCYLCHKKADYDKHDNEGCDFQKKWYATLSNNPAQPAKASLAAQQMVPTTSTPDGAGTNPVPAANQSSRPSVDGLNANNGKDKSKKGKGGSSSACMISEDGGKSTSEQEEEDFLYAIHVHEQEHGSVPAALLANPAAILSETDEVAARTSSASTSSRAASLAYLQKVQANMPKMRAPKSKLKNKSLSVSEEKEENIDEQIASFMMMSRDTSSSSSSSSSSNRPGASDPTTSVIKESGMKMSSSELKDFTREKGRINDISSLVYAMKHLVIRHSGFYFRDKRKSILTQLHSALEAMSIIISSSYYSLSDIFLDDSLYTVRNTPNILARLHSPALQWYLFRYAQGYAAQAVLTRWEGEIRRVRDIAKASLPSSHSSAVAADEKEPPITIPVLALRPFATDLGTRALSYALGRMDKAIGSTFKLDDMLPPLVSEATAIHLNSQSFTLDLNNLVEKGDVMWTTVLNRIPTLPPYLLDGAADRDEPLYKAVRVDGGAILPNIGTHVPRPHSAADAIPALTEPQCLMQEPNFSVIKSRGRISVPQNSKLNCREE
jgi:hypothetical protein